MLKINSISKSFKNNLVFDNVSLECHRGEISGFIGPNGSGKSVFFKVISGFLKPSSGEIQYDGAVVGKDIDFLPNLGVLIEKPGFIENYTHKKNLEYLAAISGLITKEDIDDVLIKVGLDPNLNTKVKNFSLGMRQRLGIAQAIMENQEIIVLDEPFNGLDKRGQSEMKEVINSLRNDNKVILLTSHIDGDIEELADVIYEFTESTIKKI